MTETSQPIETLEIRRKKLRFRAWHRGIREADLLLGRFADSCIDGLDGSLLAQFEALLETPDPILYDWLSGRTPIPEAARCEILERLKQFHQETSAL